MSAAAVDPAAFRRLMGRWPTGVAVVTGREGPVDVGLTVNALVSVSLAPPTVLVSLSVDADSTAPIERTGRFAVSFLAAGQRPLSERFARPGPAPPKFAGLEIARTPGGLAVLPGALGRMECRIRAVLPGGDHRLVVGEVVWVDLPDDGLPLVYARSGYAEPDGSGALRLPPPKSP